jgi:hypothetical protein
MVAGCGCRRVVASKVVVVVVGDAVMVVVVGRCSFSKGALPSLSLPPPRRLGQLQLQRLLSSSFVGVGSCSCNCLVDNLNGGVAVDNKRWLLRRRHSGKLQ